MSDDKREIIKESETLAHLRKRDVQNQTPPPPPAPPPPPSNTGGKP